jgi:hypothetical protein
MMGGVTVPQAGWYGVRILIGQNIFLFSKLALRSTQPSVEGVPEFFPGIKVARREVDYSQISSSEVRVQLYLFPSCMLS